MMRKQMVPESQTSLNFSPPATYLFYQYLTVLSLLKVTYTDRHILLLKTGNSNFSSCDSSVTQHQLLHPLDNMAFLLGFSMTPPFPQQRRIYEYLLERLFSYFIISLIVLHCIFNCNNKLGLSLVNFPHWSMCQTEPTNSLQN